MSRGLVLQASVFHSEGCATVNLKEIEGIERSEGDCDVKAPAGLLSVEYSSRSETYIAPDCIVSATNSIPPSWLCQKALIMPYETFRIAIDAGLASILWSHCALQHGSRRRVGQDLEYCGRL